MSHPDEAVLHDRVDGRLDDAAAVHLDRHLAECPTCRARLEAIQSLADRMAALPSGISPRRDLRPLAPDPGPAPADPQPASPHPDRAATRPSATPPGALRSPWLRAAAIGGVVLGVGWWLVADGRVDAPSTSTSPTATPSTMPTATDAYARAAADLMAALDDRRTELDPGTASALTATLGHVDAAIRELEQARARVGDRERAGGRTGLEAQLEARYRTKLDLLRTAMDLLEET